MKKQARREELWSYAAACLQMYLQAELRGVKLRDVEAYLCEDGRTVVLDAYDLEIMATFMLAKKTNEADFDQDRFKYIEGLNSEN